MCLFLSIQFIFFNQLESLILTIFSLVTLLVSIAYFTLAERKVIASVQRRVGPQVIGLYGLLQPLADGLKLLCKEIIVPNLSNKKLFFLAPLLTLFLSFNAWLTIPNSFDSYLVDFNLSLLYILMISSLGVYTILLAG
jgi:NADH:ubiquinone oxidoreductase subunit H